MFCSHRLTPGVAEEEVGEQYIGNVLEWSEGRIITLHDLLLPHFSYLWVVPQELPLDSLPSLPCPHGGLASSTTHTLTDFEKRVLFVVQSEYWQ